MDPIKEFREQVQANIKNLGNDSAIQRLSTLWLRESNRFHYSYNYSWLGRPIIQYPQDIVAMQEIIWQVKPDLIIETGIAHGGSLVLSASMLALLDMCDSMEAGALFDPRASKRAVVGIDIDIRAHNRAAIEVHPMASRIHMVQGSSTDPDTIAEVKQIAARYTRVLVALDSNHTHEHVLAELDAYAPLASVGSYCVVFDTLIEELPKELFLNRPWGPTDNPKTAVWAWLKSHPEFEVDKSIQHKLLITVAPDGYLRRIA